MAAVLVIKKAVVASGYYHFWGEAVFVNSESKSGNFDTKATPLNLSLFKEGTITLKVASKSSSPVLNVNIVAQDHKTGDWRIVGSLSELTENGSVSVEVFRLSHAMAIDATLAGGSFTITITGEFKRGHMQ